MLHLAGLLIFSRRYPSTALLGVQARNLKKRRLKGSKKDCAQSLFLLSQQPDSFRHGLRPFSE
jgi:hypothetical protein